MNFLLTPSKGKAEEHAGVHCSYCKRVFKNRQALGGHLRVHKEEINAKRSQSYASHFSNSIKMNYNVLPFSMHHPRSGVHGSNPSNLFNKVTSSLDFSKRFYSNQNSRMNMSKFYENNSSAMPPKFSSSSGQAEIPGSKTLSFMAASPASSGSTTLTSEFNTDQFQCFTNGVPSFYVNALISHLVKVVTDLHLGPSSNQSPSFKEPSTVGSLPLNPSQSSGLGEIGQYKMQTILTFEKRKRCFVREEGNAKMMNVFNRPKINSKLLMETIKPRHLSQSSSQGEIGQNKRQAVLKSIGAKRHFLGEGGASTEIMTAPKRCKINSNLSLETDQPPKRELLLFEDPEKCFFGSSIASNAKEESETNLDLSLHL